jgi:Holliday junction resolvase RusA-like endonuclease
MVIQAAQAHISTPITEDDIEFELLYSTLTKKGVRADIDNIIKPNLDALKGMAYNDDIQVRSVTATLFDRNKENIVSGRVEHM